MATTRVISWILGNGLYAYIYMPEGKSQIGNKIVDDSPLWQKIVEKVGEWGQSEYESAYAALSNTVQSKGYSLPPYDPKYYDGGVQLSGYKLALLSGVGGAGGGSGSGTGPTGGVADGIDTSAYDKFMEEMDKELNKAKEELEKKAEEIKNYVEEEFNETYFEAKDEIAHTKEELDKIREDLEEKYNGAMDALDAARDALADGKIDSDEMDDIFNRVQEYSDWMNAYSGVVVDLKAEYDDINGQLGTLGTAEDASAGLFAKFATCISTVSGTVGNVHDWMVASSATIGQVASWYDESGQTATEAMRYISASSGIIQDTINYIYGDGESGMTAKLSSIMDAKNATMRDSIMTETNSGITSVKREMDGLRGEINEQITRLAPNGDLVDMRDRMDAAEFEMERYMTKISEISGTAIDLRETWNEASGKLSTVANLVAETDENGNVLYFASGGTKGEDNFWEIPVFKNEDETWSDSTGELIFNKDQIYAKFSQTVGSWFQQKSDEISLGIKDELKDLAAGITMSFSGDESFIKMVADNIVISGDMIAEALSAKSGNIGGIMLGEGKVECMIKNFGNPMFLLDGYSGEIYGQKLTVDGNAALRGNVDISGTVNISGDAKIEGSITATSLTLGVHYGNKDIKDYIDEQMPADLTSSSDVKTMISEYVSSEEFKNSITKGYITADDLEEWARQNPNLTEEQIKELIKNYGNTEINVTFTSTTEDGKTKHTIKIGDKEYVWYTYELTDVNGDGFLMLDRPYTGDTESGKTSVMISTNGLLQANNAVIHGCVYANAGEIGGLKLNNSRLMVSRNGNYNDSIAYLNGSNTYYDSERGTIILAAGISSGCTYHKYTSLESTNYSTIYTKKKYLTENGDESGCEVEAYVYNTLTQTYTRLENQFYFFTANSTEQSSEDDIITKDSDGNDIFIKQYVVRKYYIQTSQDGDLDEEVDEYSYAGTVSAKEAVANTRIFEDGTIISNTLVANDGYFGGEINAIGKFRGTLENVGGTLKGVTIDANLINGNIVIRNSDSIKAKSNNQLYFNVGKEPLSDNSTKEYWNVDEFFWERKNSNGTNAGQYYNDWSTIAYVPFKSGATITIPALEGSIYRYAADGKTNNESYLWVACTVLYDGSTTEETLIRKTITASSHGHNSTPTYKITTGKDIFTMEKDGVLSVTFGYDVHLSTYSWLNADKSYAKVKFNTGGSKIIVEYPKPIEGVSIASNGMRVLTVSGASVSVIGEKITLLSPNKKYGLRITDSGVQIRRDSTDETKWVNL